MKFRRASPQISPASVAGMSSIEDERPRKRTRTRSGRLSGWATSAAPPPPAPRTTFLDLDEDCHSRILSLLAPADIARAMRACKALARAGASRTVFRALSLRLEPDPDVVNALDKEGADDDHGMGTFVKLRDDPLRRYKFISPLPTLGLNVCDNDSPGLPVYGGFSYPSLTKGQKLTNHADMADYTSFDAREVCEPRRTHRSRMWFCRDVLTFEDVAVKVLPFQESPDEGFMCRKLREVSNLKALEGGTAVTPLTKAVTVTGKLPFPRDDENDENENWENDSDEERERRKREDEAAKLLLVHPYYPVNMRAQWTRSCDAEHAASCRPPVEWIDQTDGRLLPERARSVFRQVLEGLDYAHSRGICHRNLHAGHVLLDPRANDGEGRAVIASWASSRKNQWPVGNQSPLRTCTVPYYVAPEGLLHRDADEDEDELEDEDGNVVDDPRGAKYGTGVDVWAAGCVFAELLLGHSLFNKFAYADGAQTLDQLLCVFKLFGTPTEETWPDAMSYRGWSPDAYPKWTPAPLSTVFPNIGACAADLLWRLMALDPSKRITARRALKHPYFTRPDLDVPVVVRARRPERAAVEGERYADAGRILRRKKRQAAAFDATFGGTKTTREERRDERPPPRDETDDDGRLEWEMRGEIPGGKTLRGRYMHVPCRFVDVYGEYPAGTYVIVEYEEHPRKGEEKCCEPGGGGASLWPGYVVQPVRLEGGRKLVVSARLGRLLVSENFVLEHLML
jgi:serine/threonine protein kinase